MKPFFCEPEDAVYICTEDGQIVLGLDGSGVVSDEDVKQILRQDCAAGIRKLHLLCLGLAEKSCSPTTRSPDSLLSTARS